MKINCDAVGDEAVGSRDDSQVEALKDLVKRRIALGSVVLNSSVQQVSHAGKWVVALRKVAAVSERYYDVWRLNSTIGCPWKQTKSIDRRGLSRYT